MRELPSTVTVKSVLTSSWPVKKLRGNEMSPREQIQNQLTDWLETTSDKWTAPYGILPGMEDLPRGGKVRTITFGMARWLDATVYIWSPTKFTFRAAGPRSPGLDGVTCKSLDEVIDLLTKL